MDDEKQEQQQDDLTLQKWKKKLENALSDHAPHRANMDLWDSLYHGTKAVGTLAQPSLMSDRTGRPAQDARQVVNIVLQLVESQIDLNIPQPNILPMEPLDEGPAKTIEGMLTYKVNSSTMERINDENERIVKKFSVAWYKLGWNPNIQKHTFTGDFEVTNPHPKNVIPQPGVYRVSDMDYLFHIETRTNAYIARTYGEEFADLLRDETAEYEYLESNNNTSDSTDTDKVSVVECWYKDKDNDVCLLVWANDVILKDLPKFYYKRDTTGNIIEQEEIEDSLGDAIPVKAYIPKSFPFVLQYNIPRDKSLYGKSDPEIIMDQQEGVKKALSIEEEKLIKGTTKILTRDKTLLNKLTNAVSQTLYTEDPHGTVAIDLKTPDNSYKDYYMLLTAAAKEVLGVNDAWLGKAPNDVRSGKALQQLTQNAASRINTKVNGKKLAYKELYKLMVDFMLAFYDEDRPYRILGNNNQYEYGIFSRSALLRQDDAGEYFFPEFDITVDVSDGMPKDKMWTMQQAIELFGRGAMTDVDLWTILEDIGFPKSSEIKERHAQMMEQQMNQPPPGVMPPGAPPGMEQPQGPPQQPQGDPREILQQLIGQFPPEMQGVVVELIQNMPDELIGQLMAAPPEIQVQMIQEALQGGNMPNG